MVHSFQRPVKFSFAMFDEWINGARCKLMKVLGVAMKIKSWFVGVLFVDEKFPRVVQVLVNDVQEATWFLTAGGL